MCVSDQIVSRHDRWRARTIAQQYEKAKIAETSDEISLAVLDPAIPPVSRSKPNRKLLLLLGGVIGLMLSFGLVITLNLVEKYKDEQSG